MVRESLDVKGEAPARLRLIPERSSRRGRATKTILVMTNSGDAVREGFVASLDKPGGNIQGLNFGEAFEKFGHCAVLGSRRSRVTRRSIRGGGATSTSSLPSCRSHRRQGWQTRQTMGGAQATERRSPRRAECASLAVARAARPRRACAKPTTRTARREASPVSRRPRAARNRRRETDPHARFSGVIESPSRLRSLVFTGSGISEAGGLDTPVSGDPRSRFLAFVEFTNGDEPGVKLKRPGPQGGLRP